MTSDEGTARRFSGASLDEALSGACTGLRTRVGELRYDVVSDGTDGVTITAEVDPEAVLGLFLAEVFRSGGLALTARLAEEDGTLRGDLVGEDTDVLTEGDGRGLDALQYLCNRILDRRLPRHPPVHLDVQGYKTRRAGQLEERARRAAKKAVRERRRVVLPPLTPAARREIHLALAQDSRVETVSEGEGFVKRVVVIPRSGRG